MLDNLDELFWKSLSPERLRLLASQQRLANPGNLLIAEGVIESAIDPSLLKFLQITESAVSFKDIETRNQLAAEHYYYLHQHELQSEPNSCFKIAISLFEFDRKAEDRSSVRFLLLVSTEHDVIAIADTVLAPGNILSVLLLVLAVLPQLREFSTQSLIELCAKVDDLAKNDILHGVFLDELGRYLQSNATINEEIFNSIRENPDERLKRLYVYAAFVSAKDNPDLVTKVVLDDFNSENNILSSSAVGTIPVLLVHPKSSPTSVAQMKNALHSALSNVDLCTAAVRAIKFNELVQKTYTEFDDEILSLALKGSLDALDACSRLLHDFGREDNRKAFMQTALPELVNVFRFSNLESYWLDSLLADLLTVEEFHTLALRSLVNWVSPPFMYDKRIRPVRSVFPAVLNALQANQKLLSSVITEMLTHSSQQVSCATSDIFGELFVCKYQDRLEFDESKLQQMKESDLILLCLRVVSIVIYGQYQVPLLISVLTVPGLSEETVDEFKGILLTECVNNFTSYLVPELEQLVATTQNPLLKKLCDEVLAQIELESEAISNLPKRKELEPSAKLELELGKAQNRKFNRQFREQGKQSALRAIATTVPLKAGVKYFHFDGEKYSPQTELQKFEQTVTLGTNILWDPIGQMQRHLEYKLLETTK